MMKTTMVAVCLAAMVLTGCARFGTFANLHRGETTMEEVVYMLGEPETRSFDDDREIWFYSFVATGRYRDGDMQTVMSVAVVFDDGVVEKYEITSSQQTVSAEGLEGGGLRPMPPGLLPVRRPGMTPQGAPGAGGRPPRRRR